MLLRRQATLDMVFAAAIGRNPAWASGCLKEEKAAAEAFCDDLPNFNLDLNDLVGVRGFEPPASTSRT
jgi:hypothetical protein